jgi:hypothetical protein
MTMTVKELAEFFGKSTRTIHRKAADIGMKLEEGKKTEFNEKQVRELSYELYKTQPKWLIDGIDNLIYGDKVSRQSVGVDYEKMASCVAQAVSMAMIPIVKELTAGQKSIEFKQDYFTIKAYAQRIDLKLLFSEALSFGKQAGKLSRERNVEIRQVDDERWGKVNSYKIDILEEVFAL